MRVTLWGVRGSCPAPGPSTVRYGGNTSCVEARLDDGSVLVLDAGTGIRALGRRLLGESIRVPVTVLISHPHWDHIQGFPFFLPAYRRSWHIRVTGWSQSLHAIQALLQSQMDGMTFPVEFGELEADIEFLELMDGPQGLDSAVLQVGVCSHPGGCSCFQLVGPAGGRLMYVTDNELGAPDGAMRDPHSRVVEMCAGADVLIHDAQYLPEELALRQGWGHSSYEDAVDLAGAAGVGRLVLFHHDPDRTDDELDEIQERAQKYATKRGYATQCLAGYEGMHFTV